MKAVLILGVVDCTGAEFRDASTGTRDSSSKKALSSSVIDFTVAASDNFKLGTVDLDFEVADLVGSVGCLNLEDLILLEVCFELEHFGSSGRIFDSLPSTCFEPLEDVVDEPSFEKALFNIEPRILTDFFAGFELEAWGDFFECGVILSWCTVKRYLGVFFGVVMALFILSHETLPPSQIRHVVTTFT